MFRTPAHRGAFSIDAAINAAHLNVRNLEPCSKYFKIMSIGKVRDNHCDVHGGEFAPSVLPCAHIK